MVKIGKHALLLTLLVLLGTTSLATLAEYPAGQETSYEHALTLARSGQYPAALEIFHQLSPRATNPNILYDHAIVLTWSGDYASAISLYEKQITLLPVVIPSYVKTSMAGAYYRLSQFKDAQLLFHEVALTGDRQAKRWEGESFMRMRDIKSANELYQELLTTNPKDRDTYLSRASMFLLLGNTVSAAVDLNKVLSLLPNDQGGKEQDLQIRGDMAAAFIQHDDYNRAIILLQPPIAAGSATMKMQANYILALKLNGDYTRAIVQGTLLWSDLNLVPDFGLQALGDCYLRMKQPATAASLYQRILTRHNEDTNLNTITLSLAYADLTKGEIQTGLDRYQDLLPANPTFGPIVALDANSFIESGQVHRGKELYQLLLHNFPDNPLYLNSYGAVLTANHMPREGYQQYQQVTQLSKENITGLSGLATTAMTIGDYKTAHSTIQHLKDKYPLYAITGDAVAKYENLNGKLLETSYQVTHDYKGNSVTEATLTGSQHGDGRFSILASTNHQKIGDTNNSTTLSSLGLGLQYQDVQRDTKLWVTNYDHHNTFTGYQLLTNHYFNDGTFIKIHIEKSPVAEVQALSYPIMSTSQQIILTRNIGSKDVYTLGVTSSGYSDGNHSTTYTGTFDHTLPTRNNNNTSWFAYASRTSYNHQEINATPTPYESPRVRESYGLGITERWDHQNSALSGRLTAEWGRDRPEIFGFSPSIALEYEYNFSPTHSLQMGAQYSFHTATTISGRNLGFGSSNYHLNYQLTW